MAAAIGLSTDGKIKAYNRDIDVLRKPSLSPHLPTFPADRKLVHVSTEWEQLPTFSLMSVLRSALSLQGGQSPSWQGKRDICSSRAFRCDRRSLACVAVLLLVCYGSDLALCSVTAQHESSL